MWQEASRSIVLGVLWLFLDEITMFASCQLSNICFVLNMFLKMFVRQVRTLCPPPPPPPSSLVYDIVCNSVYPFGFMGVFFHHFYGPFYIFLCKLEYYFCVWTWFHCTSWYGHCLVAEWFVEICAYSWNFFSLWFDCSSFFPHAHCVCLFLCLFVCLGPFLASKVPCIKSFLFPFALFLRFFFTIFFSSAYCTMSFNVLLFLSQFSPFHILIFNFLSKFSVSVSSALFLFMKIFTL